MNTYIDSGRVWWVDCTPENPTHVWNIAVPDGKQKLLEQVMTALWRKHDTSSYKAAF